ncbi:unnamed protein product [Paramecium sonneborni]|uniref:ER membrane protein complex subunit 4 n=1 Tax=Paramecium sonneborni TaxID=65129 RepID=A0A8S1M5N9_9CILI|nr:unnamed protein product [Paramecium sonneborni]CAD8075998.1 unnamed protein product [Paramecium sonneborni]
MWEIKIKREKSLPEPVGYKKAFDDCQGQELREDLEKKAMAIAKGGFGNIFMIMFTLYMTGNMMNIFTIVIIGQFLWQAISTIAKMDQAFSLLENRGISLFFYKLIYLSAGLLQLGVVLYKLYNIGLLPLNSADWIDLVPLHHQEEIVVPYSYN